MAERQAQKIDTAALQLTVCIGEVRAFTAVLPGTKAKLKILITS